MLSLNLDYDLFIYSYQWEQKQEVSVLHIEITSIIDIFILLCHGSHHLDIENHNQAKASVIIIVLWLEEVSTIV